MTSSEISRVANSVGNMEMYQSMETVNKRAGINQVRLANAKHPTASEGDLAGTNVIPAIDIHRNDLKNAIAAISDGKNMLSVTEDGLRKIADVLANMKALVINAASSEVGSQGRESIVLQLNAYAEEINQIVDQTKWDGNDLIGFSASVIKHFYVGVSGSGESVFTDFSFNGSGSSGFSSTALGIKNQTNKTSYVENDINFTEYSGAGITTLENIVKAIRTVKDGIIQTGSFSSRLTFIEDTILQANLNPDLPYNRILNTNMAQEQIDATKNQIMHQTSNVLMAQVNTNPQILMSLFR